MKRRETPGIFIIILVATLLFGACSKPSPVAITPNETDASSNKTLSAPAVKAIKTKFPGAVPYQLGIDSLLQYLKHFGIQPDNILWGQSTCVDDIINTKNKMLPEIKGPFNFGGLAGLPFTGITGLNAFAHHVPEGGTALLFVGPHIGYNEKEGWGKILRHDQQHPSSCCGALAAALAKLQKGEIKPQSPTPDDYQEGTIEQLALAHQKEILSSSDPLISFTKLTYQEAARELTNYASKVKERHFRYAVIVGVIIINTDFRFTDYLSVETVSILDIQKNKWIEVRKPKGKPTIMTGQQAGRTLSLQNEPK